MTVIVAITIDGIKSTHAYEAPAVIQSEHQVRRRRAKSQLRVDSLVTKLQMQVNKDTAKCHMYSHNTEQDQEDACNSACGDKER